MMLLGKNCKDVFQIVKSYVQIGNVVALFIGHQTCDLQVVGSSPGWPPLHSVLGLDT